MYSTIFPCSDESKSFGIESGEIWRGGIGTDFVGFSGLKRTEGENYAGAEYSKYSST